MERLAWPNNQCILCLSSKALTDEHIIPKCIGGTLVCKFLCQQCNNSCGHKFEADAKESSVIRLAIANLKSQLPELYQSIETGQKYLTKYGSNNAIQNLNKRGHLNETKLEDGSIIVPQESVSGHSKRILQKAGVDQKDSDTKLLEVKNAPSGEIVELTNNYKLINWKGQKSAAYLKGGDLSSIFILKIVYEFLALIIGAPILENHDSLNQVRRVILSNNETMADKWVKKHRAGKYASFHGICFFGNKPFAEFQVRLFGWLAYQVTLPNISLNRSRVVYTHELIEDEHLIKEY